MGSKPKTTDQLFGRAAVIPFPLDRLWLRATVFLAGGGLLSLLLAARWLTPDLRGLGTHEQLGLPPCGFYLWWGIPCPSCGMTTSWAWLVRGEVTEAVRQHFGGALLALFSFALGSWLVLSAIFGRWVGGWPSSLAWAMTMAGLAVAIVISWIGKLWA